MAVVSKTRLDPVQGEQIRRSAATLEKPAPGGPIVLFPLGKGVPANTNGGGTPLLSVSGGHSAAVAGVRHGEPVGEALLPKKRTRGPGKKPKKAGPRYQPVAPEKDKRRKRWIREIDPATRRDHLGAIAYAHAICRPLKCCIDFHPAHMERYPEGDLGTWFRKDLLPRLARWFKNRGGWYCIWVREAYERSRSEHIHIICNCPVSLRAKLRKAILGWYSGSPDMVAVHALRAGGLNYRHKQCRTTTQGPLRPGRLYRETRNRKTGSPVAPVYGKKAGVSDSLSLSKSPGRRAWQKQREQSRG